MIRKFITLTFFALAILMADSIFAQNKAILQDYLNDFTTQLNNIADVNNSYDDKLLFKEDILDRFFIRNNTICHNLFREKGSTEIFGEDFLDIILIDFKKALASEIKIIDFTSYEQEILIRATFSHKKSNEIITNPISILLRVDAFSGTGLKGKIATIINGHISIASIPNKSVVLVRKINGNRSIVRKDNETIERIRLGKTPGYNPPRELSGPTAAIYSVLVPGLGNAFVNEKMRAKDFVLPAFAIGGIVGGIVQYNKSNDTWQQFLDATDPNLITQYKEQSESQLSTSRILFAVGAGFWIADIVKVYIKGKKNKDLKSISFELKSTSTAPGAIALNYTF